MPPTQISRQAAHEIIETADIGYVVVVNAIPEPTIGHVPPDEREWQPMVDTFRFE